MRGAPKAPRRDTRSPFLIIEFRWRRDCLEREYTTRRCAPSVRWSTKNGATPQSCSLHMTSPVPVCSASVCPPEHALELAMIAGATHRLPSVSGFLGDEHGPTNCAKRHSLSQFCRPKLPAVQPRVCTRARQCALSNGQSTEGQMSLFRGYVWQRPDKVTFRVL
jgi:hypothetical protein